MTMRRIAFSFQPSVSVCGAPCHASYLRIGKIGLLPTSTGFPLGAIVIIPNPIVPTTSSHAVESKNDHDLPFHHY